MEWCETLINNDQNALKLLGYFGRSLAWNDWDIEQHPDFKTFCSGAMASSCCPLELRMDDHMRQLFRPKPLVGIVRPLQWRGPDT
jgi:hypothetical protein